MVGVVDSLAGVGGGGGGGGLCCDGRRVRAPVPLFPAAGCKVSNSTSRTPIVFC